MAIVYRPKSNPKRTFWGRRRRYGTLPSFEECRTTGAHMIRTECQTLDEAIQVLKNRKRHKLTARNQKMKVKGGAESLDQEFGYKPKTKITLPRVKFLERAE